MLTLFLRAGTFTCLFVKGVALLVIAYITHYLHYILEISPVQLFRSHNHEEFFQWEACYKTRGWGTSLLARAILVVQ